MSVDETVHTVCCLCIWTDLLFMSGVCAMRLAAPIHSCPSLLLGLCPSSVWASGRLFILCLRGHSFCHSDLSLSSISCLLPGGKGMSACSSSPWAVLRSAQCLVWVTSTPLFFYHWHGFFLPLTQTRHCALRNTADQGKVILLLAEEVRSFWV